MFVLTSSLVWCCFYYVCNDWCVVSYFYCIVFLHMNVWCVENESFKGFLEGEDFEEFEHQEFVEGKSLMQSCLPKYNMHFNYTILFIALHELDEILLKV